MPAMKIGTASSEKRVGSFGIGMMSRASTTEMAASRADVARMRTFFRPVCCAEGAAAA